MRNILTRMVGSLKQVGLYGTYLKLYALFSDPFFDIRFGTDTSSIVELNQLTIESNNRKNGVHYQPTKVVFLRKFLKYIQHLIPASSVMIDLGSGKGRVLLIASEFGFREVRGVEFAHELCETAKNNISVYTTKKGSDADFRVIESDVTKYPIQTDENVIFMFNPFNESIMEQVLNNIKLSLQICPRDILIIYVNPTCENLIKSFQG